MKKQVNKNKKTTTTTKNKQHPKTATQVNSTPKKINLNHSFNKIHLLWIFIVAAITAAAYLPALDNELTNWDDKGYVVDNKNIRDLNTERIVKLFYNSDLPEEEGKLPYEMGNYHPMTMLSLGIDYHFSHKTPSKKPEESPEPDPFIFHLHNVMLHLFNTILVFLLVYMLSARFEKTTILSGQVKSYALHIAVIASALFGLNAIHVESVAWVAERKDVLYAFYFLLSLVFYVVYTHKKAMPYFIAAIIAFLLSLLSKGQAVSLTISLFAIDYFIGRKLFDKKNLIEKIPFFVLSLIFGLIAIKAQQHGEAIHDIDEYPFYQRIAFASYAYVMYIAKMLVPINLSAIYPYPHPFDGGMPSYFWLMPFLVGGVIYAFVKSVKQNKELAFAILFFSINIFLLLQLLPVGSAIMADRYSYIPSIGFFLLFGFAFKWIAIKLKNNLTPLYAILVGLSAFYFVRTWQQSDVWQDNLSLWNHSLEISPRGVVAWNNRGSAKDKLDLKEEAIADFSEAVRLKPDYTHAFYNRGTAKKDLNRFKEALTDFNSALNIDPNFLEAYHNRGIAYEGIGMLTEAINDYDKALSLDPSKANIYASRGVAKGKMSQSEKDNNKKIEWLNKAVVDFNLSISKRAINSEAYSNRGFATVQIGQIKNDVNIIKKGISDYNKSLEYNEKSDEARYNRGLAYLLLSDTIKAIADFSDLIKEHPEHESGLAQIAAINTKQQKYEEAIAYYKRVIKLAPEKIYYHNYLANIYYNIKKWTEAIKMYDFVLEKSPQYGQGYLNRGLAKISNGQQAEGCKDLSIAASKGVKEAAPAITRYCR